MSHAHGESFPHDITNENISNNENEHDFTSTSAIADAKVLCINPNETERFWSSDDHENEEKEVKLSSMVTFGKLTLMWSLRRCAHNRSFKHKLTMLMHYQHLLVLHLRRLRNEGKFYQE